MPRLEVRQERWPTRGTFRISRGARTEVEVVVVELHDGGHAGRGECVPYARYQETVPGVMAQIEGLRSAVEGGLTRAELQSRLHAGAARNALDCALWDLEAKRTGRPVWALAGLGEPGPLTTAFTLSLDTVEAMAENARRNADRPLLKLKLAGPDDLGRVRAVRAAAPGARLIVDANEGWDVATCRMLLPQLRALGVAMVEQPLPAGDDAALAGIERVVPICADESCHDAATLPGLVGRYDMINIKLDKTGGLTEALLLKAAAARAGFGIMVGCMLATSLGMAPAILVAQGVAVVDLDGPLLLARDRDRGLRYEGSVVHPPVAALWG